MDKIKVYRPLKNPPRPESIKELSPFGEKLLTILQENRLRDRDNSINQINPQRRFVNGDDIMQQLRRWDDGKSANKLLNVSRTKSTSVPPFSKLLEAKSTVNSHLNATERSSSTETINYNHNRQDSPPTFVRESCFGSSTQNKIINLKRTSIFAEELQVNRKKICNKFQVPLRQTQLENITNRNFQNSTSQFRLQRRNNGNKTTEKRLGVLEIEMGGKPCPMKKTTQKTIGDFFGARSLSTDKNNNTEDDKNIDDDDNNEEGSDWETEITQHNEQGVLKMKNHTDFGQNFASFKTYNNVEDRNNINNVEESTCETKMTQANKQGAELKMKNHTDFSQSLASFITFPDEDDGQIIFSHRFEQSCRPNDDRKADFSEAKSEDNFLVSIDDLIDANNGNSRVEDEDDFSEAKSEDSFLVSIDDLLDANKASNNGNLRVEDDDDYTVDIFGKEEMENSSTTKTSNEFEAGIDKIRNKLMKFRRIEDND